MAGEIVHQREHGARVAAGHAARRQAGRVEGREQVAVCGGPHVVVLVHEGGPRGVGDEGDEHGGADQGLDPPAVPPDGRHLGAAAGPPELHRGDGHVLHRRHAVLLSGLPSPSSRGGRQPTCARRARGAGVRAGLIISDASGGDTTRCSSRQEPRRRPAPPGIGSNHARHSLHHPHPAPRPPPDPRRPAGVGVGVGPRRRGAPPQRRRPGSAPASPWSPGCWASRTPSCPSWRTPCWPATTSSSWASAARPRPGLIRSLVELLDEWLPVIAGSEINDDPYLPTSRFARVKVAEEGDETPIAWLHRSDRYGEKLATPDTSIADLIGEVDPIKVAEGRYLSDELALHYGLVPRVNRGIFAINELPDLAERIQVGLLNVLEERDVQIRGPPDPPPPRRDAGGHRQPRGLHQPGPDHHPAEGPLRGPDPHPLPARHPDRDGGDALGGRAARATARR